MFSFFFSLLFVIPLIALMVLLGVLGFFSRLIFGKGQSRNPHGAPNSDAGNRQTEGSFFNRRKKKKKIFDSNDGEYVDYVEVNE